MSGRLFVAAPAKINLFLHVGEKRADGFHDLESLALFARCGDEVRLEPSDGISLSVEGPFGTELPRSKDNLAIRAAHMLAERTGTSEGANIRLCKGIYNELPAIAFKAREEIQSNYLHTLRIIFDAGTYVGIATHDDVLIDGAYEMIRTRGLRRDQYEFQMLLGVREKRRSEIVRDGHRLRVYVPFGEQWYAYSTRRLKENPSMAWYITKAIFVR